MKGGFEVQRLCSSRDVNKMLSMVGRSPAFRAPSSHPHGNPAPQPGCGAAGAGRSREGTWRVLDVTSPSFQASTGTCASLTSTSVPAPPARTVPSAWTAPTPTAASALKVRDAGGLQGFCPVMCHQTTSTNHLVPTSPSTCCGRCPQTIHRWG